MSRENREFLVVSCPRCHDAHEDIHFETLTRRISFPGGVFTHWTTCPHTGEPILAMDKRDHRPAGMLLDDYPFTAHSVEVSS